MIRMRTEEVHEFLPSMGRAPAYAHFNVEGFMRATMAAVVAGIGLLLAAVPALAHHSFNAEFDAKNPFKLTGVVTKIEWKNPHAYFYMDVKDETGTVTNWGFELTSPNALMRLGWTRNSLKVGAEVTVEGSSAKDKSHIGNTTSVVLSTGQKLFAGSSQDQTP